MVSDFQEILLRVLMMRISIFVDAPCGRRKKLDNKLQEE
jgi:hypothetical protein